MIKKLLMVFSIFLTFSVASIKPRATSDEPRATKKENLVLLHSDLKEISNKTCTSKSCHPNTKKETSLKEGIFPVHAFDFEPHKDFSCNFCHLKAELDIADIGQKSAASLRRQVDVMLCALCHSVGPGKQFYQDFLCGECHESIDEKQMREPEFRSCWTPEAAYSNCPFYKDQ